MKNQLVVLGIIALLAGTAFVITGTDDSGNDIVHLDSYSPDIRPLRIHYRLAQVSAEFPFIDIQISGEGAARIEYQVGDETRTRELTISRERLAGLLQNLKTAGFLEGNTTGSTGFGAEGRTTLTLTAGSRTATVGFERGAEPARLASVLAFFQKVFDEAVRQGTSG